MFFKCVYKAVEHSYSTINHVDACWNPMSVYHRNWCDMVCKNGYIGMGVKENYNELYETLSNEEMDLH